MDYFLPKAPIGKGMFTTFEYDIKSFQIDNLKC